MWHEHNFTTMYLPPAGESCIGRYEQKCGCGLVSASWWIDPLDGKLIQIFPKDYVQ